MHMLHIHRGDLAAVPTQAPWPAPAQSLITRRGGRTYGWAVVAGCARAQLANLLVLQVSSGNKPGGKTSLVR